MSLQAEMRKGFMYTIARLSLFVLLTSVPLLFIQLYFSGNWYAIGHSYSIAMLFGITSYSLFCCTLILSTRVRFLDKLFGHDRILRFHGYLAAAAILSGIIHCILKTGFIESFTLQTVPGISGLAIFITIAFMTFVYISAGQLAMVPFFSKLRMFVSKRFTLDYSRAKLLHNLFGFAVACILIHILWASSTLESLLRISFIGALGAAAFLRYFYHKLLRPLFNLSREFYIASVEKPAPDVVRLTVSSKSGNGLSFLPGQFAYLKIKSPETGGEEHPFSLSSTPASPVVQVTIKKVGDYTSRLENLKKGTRVVIDGPYGLFTPIADDRNKVFIAGGIGITPMLSILPSWQTLTQAPKSILFWSVANEADLIDRTIFELMVKECAWFSFVPLLTQDHNSRYTYGRITPELIAASGALETIRKTDFYLCGPPPMIRQLVCFLRSEGVPKPSIHYELFAF